MARQSYKTSQVFKKVDNLPESAVFAVDSIKGLGDVQRVDGGIYSVSGFYPSEEAGAAAFVYRLSADRALNNGTIILSPAAIESWDGTDADISTLRAPGSGTGCFVMLSGQVIYDVDVSIPSHYATLQSAIDDLYGRVSTENGSIIDLIVEMGHAPTSGIAVSNGDYGDFRISSVAAEVIPSGDFSITMDNARAPILNTLIDLQNSTAFDSYTANHGSVGVINPGCGMKNGVRGLHSTNVSDVYADESIFTGFEQAGIHCSRNSRVQCTSAVLSGNNTSGSNFGALYASRGSIIHGQYIDATDSTYAAVRAQRFAQIVCPSIDISGAAGYGFLAGLGGKIFCVTDDFTADNMQAQAVLCQNGEVVIQGVFNNTSSFAGIAVECRGGRVSIGGTINGYAGTVLYAQEGGALSARGVTLTSGSNGLLAEQGGRINARSATITGMTNNGVFANRGGFVEIVDGSVTGSGSDDLAIDQGSWIAASNCTTTNGVGSPALTDTNATGFNFADNGNKGFIWA